MIKILSFQAFCKWYLFTEMVRYPYRICSTNDLSCYRFYDFMGIDFEMNQKPVTKKH